MSKKKKKSKKAKVKGTLRTDRIIKLALIVVIIVFIVVLYKIFDKTVLSEEKVNLSGEKYYQYFYGLRQDYEGKINVEKENDATKMVLEDGTVVYLDSTPMYYSDILGKAILPSNMELVAVDDGLYKLKSFTNIIKENDTIYSKKHNKKAQKALINSFLFDGQDMYFFLEETTVKVGGIDYVLPPLSYVIVSYKDSVELYNYDKDEYLIFNDSETVNLDVTAENASGSYRINLSVDSVSSAKSQYLLISNIDNLKEIEY